jgi:uncharacterized protein YdaU (DUF1376 family)
VDYYKRYMGDYQRDTSHLSLAEHGAYTVLLDHYYSRRRPLPGAMESLHRLCRATTKLEQGAVNAVADEFFLLEDDGLRHNQRADEEIEKWEQMAQENRERGKRGGRPKKNPNGNPGGNQSGFNGDNPDETQRVSSGFEKQAFSKPAENPLQILSQKPKPEPHPQSVCAREEAGEPLEGQPGDGDESEPSRGVKGKPADNPDDPLHTWKRDEPQCDVQAHETWIEYRTQEGEDLKAHVRLMNARFLAKKGTPEQQRAFIEKIIRLKFKRIAEPTWGAEAAKPAKEGRTHAGLPIVNP